MKWGKYAKIRVKMLKQRTLSCRPPVPTTLTSFTLEQTQKLVHVSGFRKYLLFSTRTDISGVTLIYTWDTFLGHPVFAVVEMWLQILFTADL